MYILCAHLDGVGGFSGNCDDDASGTALVVEAARAFAGAAVSTRCSIRFFLTNGHEAGYKGAIEYRDNRHDLQGKENPPGSRQFPEPVWLGLINQDLILYDHGNPAGPVQIPQASIRVNYCPWSYAESSLYMAQQFIAIDKVIFVGYPAVIPAGGGGLGAFDAGQFANYCPVISPEEGGGDAGYIANPLHHDDADTYETYSEADFALAFSAVQREVGEMAFLTQTTITGNTPAKSEPPVANAAPLSSSWSLLTRQHELTISASSRGTHTVKLSSLDGTPIMRRIGQGRMSYSLRTESVGAGLYVVTINADGNVMQKSVVIAR